MAGSHARRGADGPTHGHAHGHGLGTPAEVDVRRGPRLVLLGSLVAALLLTLVGVGLLWPDGDRVDELSEQVQFAAPGVTFPRVEVLSVQEPCVDGSPDGLQAGGGARRGRRGRRRRGECRRTP